MLGAVLSYGAIVAPLQAVWLETQARAPQRLFSRFGSARRGAEERRRPRGRRGRRRHRRALRPRRRRRGRRLRHGGERARRRRRSPALRHDYGQTAWVGIATFAPVRSRRHQRRRLRALHAPRPGRAAAAEGRPRRPGLVRRQRRRSGARPRRRAALAVLNTIFHPRTPRLAALSPLKSVSARPHRRAHAHRRPHGAHRQRRADPAPGRRPGPQPRHARRLRAGALARAASATSTPCCAGSSGSARPIAGR